VNYITMQVGELSEAVSLQNRSNLASQLADKKPIVHMTRVLKVCTLLHAWPPTLIGPYKRGITVVGRPSVKSKPTMSKSLTSWCCWV